MIPLLPPLVELMDPTSLCRYSGTSKTLRKEVRDTKAWALLARAQLPLKPRDEASEALSHVKSHVRRRLLADALSHRGPRGPPTAFRRNRIEEFTFFVRFEEEGRKIWEGDLNSLKSEPDSESVWFDLGPVGWTFMDENGVKITIVAIRDADDAMVSVGHFTLNNPSSGIGDAEQRYDFTSRTPLFSSERFDLRMRATLDAVHNAEGHGGLDALVLRVEHYSDEYERNDGYIDTCDESQFAYLLSYLAGTHHLARESALATIENWHVERMSPWPLVGH